MELQMRFSSFSNTTPTPIKLNPSQAQFQPLFPISPSSSQRKLLFDDINLNEPTNISASKQLSGNNLIPDVFKDGSVSCSKEFCMQTENEAGETNSFNWSLLSDRKTQRNKDVMEVEGATRTPFAKTLGSDDRYTLSRSPSPKKKHIMDSPFQKNLERDILQTPIKNRFKTEVKEKNSYTDYFSFTSRKTVETIARLNNDYDIIEVIGKGSFGKVYRCRHKLDKNEYAVKETLRKFIGKYRASGLNEIQAMASLTAIEENTNVVRYYNSWVEDEKLYLVMEFCPMSLKEQITAKGHFSETELKKILRDICLGLNYLHRNDIVHLDVKPENILISKTKAYKLGDMGQSAIARLSSDDVEEGDARYLAPELLNPGEFGEKSDLKKADVFSLGMTLFELATGYKIPVNGNDWQDLRNEKLYQLDQVEYLSPSFKKMVKLMMQRNPAQRPSAKELLTQFLPDKVNLELKWEKIEKNMLKDEKKALEGKLLQLEKRRKSL